MNLKTTGLMLLLLLFNNNTTIASNIMNNDKNLTEKELERKENRWKKLPSL